MNHKISIFHVGKSGVPREAGLRNTEGIITTLVLVFGAVFLMILSGLIGFVVVQHRLAKEKVSFAHAIDIAEAGLNYYRWHLAHDPDDLQDGTGLPGPYVHAYSDPEAGLVGTFSLDIQGSQQCGATSGVVITSTGWTEDHPNVKRIVRARYVRPTVADFSFLLNDNVWAGADREIKGPYHSNGGIRMDGENNSLVTSAVETWLCTASFGCNPASTTPGVWGAGKNSDLWRFPVPPFDFNGITADLAEIKTLTQGGNGLYFAPSGAEGYRIVLNADRSVDVWRVDDTGFVFAYSTDEGWHTEYSTIDDETFLGTYAIPMDCGLVFFEDDVWVSTETEGSTVSGKMTIVSADLINPNKETDVWLNGNITYSTTSGSDGLVILAQRNNLISLYVPDIMELDGVFVAQNGRYGRNYYPSIYNPHYKREKLEIFGSIVSNGRVGTKWSCGGVYCSGFEKRESTFDPSLSFDPPPFLSAISEEFGFKEWQELE